MMLSQVFEVLGQSAPAHDVEIQGVSIDTRSLQPGELFIALKGPNFDGHDYLVAAEKAGAVAAVVSRPVEAGLSLVMVDDTHHALIELARAHRATIHCPVIAITGSCGKTTTRAFAESIFAQCGRVLASQKSFNNNIGVPLTLLALTPEHDYAVVEVGTSGLGEIATLTDLVQPDIAMVVNAAAAHLEGLGGLEGIAREKGSIFTGLGEQGVAIINQDDAFAGLWHELAVPRRVITFARQKPADVMAQGITLNAKAQARFQLVVPEGEVEVQLPLLGAHHVENALAAAAAAVAQGISIEMIQAGLEGVEAEDRRLIEFQGLKGATIIDDSYNANPRSVQAAIDLLVNREGNPVFVFGDMLELGQEAGALHREIGEYAQAKGVKRLYCYGSHSYLAAEAFGEYADHFEDRDALLGALQDDLQGSDTVLVKGSFSMKMNEIVAGLQEGS